MSLNSGILGTVAVARESSLGGSVSGSTYNVRGFREFEFSVASPQRQIKTNVWRLAGPQKNVARYYTGRMDFVAAPDAVLGMMLDTFITRKSATAIPPISTDIYRPTRSDLPVAKGMKIFNAYENGPWLTFNGVQFESIRFQIRAKELMRVSASWRALSLTEVAVDPSWTLVDDKHYPVSPIDATIKVDAVANTQAFEYGFELNSSLRPTKVENGTAQGFMRTGPWQITGSLSEFANSASNIPALVRANTEADLQIVAPASDPTYSITIDLPRVMFEMGQPDPRGIDTVRGNYSFRVIHEAALNVSDEPLITIVRPV